MREKGHEGCSGINCHGERGGSDFMFGSTVYRINIPFIIYLNLTKPRQSWHTVVVRDSTSCSLTRPQSRSPENLYVILVFPSPDTLHSIQGRD